VGDTATGTWGSTQLGGFIRRENSRKRHEEWTAIKSAVAEEARCGWAVDAIADSLQLEEDTVRRALREIEAQSKTVLP